MFRKEYLKPYNECQKSFYKKAEVIYASNGDVWLRSYNTTVLVLTLNGPIRLWNGYSATSMRHINSLLEERGFKKNK